MDDFTHSNHSNRREFLRAGAVGLAAAAAVGQAGLLKAEPVSCPLGLSTFTVREDLKKDLPGTVKKVKAIGFKTIEFVDLLGLKPAEVRRIVNDAGLGMVSWHGRYQSIMPTYTLSLAECKAHFEKDSELAHELGVTYLTGNIWDANPSHGMEDYKWSVDLMNCAGEVCKKAGLQFLYHNLNAPFQVFDGVVPFDYVLANTDPDLVKLQIECYWIARACVDPVPYFKKYPGRTVSLHVKDKAKGYDTPTYVLDKPDPFTEVGNGSIDWIHVLDGAAAYGLKYPFYEQDYSHRASVWESVQMSYDYLMKLPLKNLTFKS